MVDLDPHEDPTPDILTLIGDLKKVYIRAEEFQTTQIGSGLTLEEDFGIIQILRQNVDVFVWKPSNMLGMDSDVMCHQLFINPNRR